MAFELGGYADKLGNRYEGRWVVKQLLHLLNETVRSVTVEAIGDDQEGVDLVVEAGAPESRKRRFEQCKARNASRDSWSLADLNSKHILEKARLQLDRGEAAEFWLVTGVSASSLGDICESARRSNGDAETYYRYQIQEVGEARRKVFTEFCKHLGLNEDDIPDRLKAFGYLRRMHVILWADDRNSEDELTGLASVLVDGNPRNVIACLADYATHNLRRRLTADDIWQHLQASGFNPRRLPYDNRVAPALEELRGRFEDSIAPVLIGGQLIQREETQHLLEMIEKCNSVVLHGATGCGKSGVLYELTTLLRDKGIAYLPVRLDRQQPKNTPREFGLDLKLPESPTLCLESQSGGRRSVLILDQLDALRWTSAHSANSLDVCKGLVREAMSLCAGGSSVCVVLSCRTFDLENDPEIKSWLGSQTHAMARCDRIEVKHLSDKVVEEVVVRCGGSFSELTQRQREILASAHHLGMWAAIVAEGHASAFQSSTELMRQFWVNRYRELARAGVSADDADTVLDLLVEYMERNGILSAPASMVGSHQNVLHEMQTLGVMRVSNGQVMFCHQSYLDFRIAQRLLCQIHRGAGTVAGWLGPKERQSLFRREQLRQVLLLLSDDSPEEFLNSLRQLLGSSNVRFHLKHLVLQIAGQIADPTPQLCHHLLELWRDSYWRPHINETAFLGQPAYVQFLMDEGVFSTLFDSTDEKDRNTASWLLRSVATKIPDAVTNLLRPYVSKGPDWPQLVLSSLCWNYEDDSDTMFELRLELVPLGAVKDYVAWNKLAAAHPMRVLRLIEAVISTWRTPTLKDDSLASQGRQSHIENWTGEELQVLKAVAAAHSVETWDLLMPHVRRLTDIAADRYDENVKDWLSGDRFGLDNGKAAISRGIVELLCEAGRAMASANTNAFLSRAQELDDGVSLVIQEILIESYASLTPEYADLAIKWVLADRKRFRLGAGYSEPEWMPAVRLIERQSPHCSPQLFQDLESSIIHYHSPDERRLAEYWLPQWREGYFGSYWGDNQYFLLPALCPERRANETNGLIGVLRRKFDRYPGEYFLRGSVGGGGCVGSPLERPNELSDNAWLGIICNRSIPAERTHKWRQIGPDRIAESSVLNFARDLAGVAKRYPDRFARLALRFPADVHPSYVAPILDGLKTTKPDGVPEDEKAAWRPVEVTTIESVFEKCQLGDEQSVAHSFCSLIRARSDEMWSGGTLNRLLDYAMNHPDPQEGSLNVYRVDQTEKEWTVDDLHQNAINCVRGAAGSALGQLLWAHPDWLSKLKPGIEHLVNDSHPAVRAAALEACLPLLNLNKDLAIDLFLQACKDDIRVAACRYAVHYFNSGMQNHPDRLGTVIRQMFNSEIDEVATEGAKEVCARWLFQGLFDNELNKGVGGTIPQRKGIASVASHFLASPDYTDRCRPLLLLLSNDTAKEVRRKVSHALFNKPEVMDLPGINSFLIEIIQSQAFRDDPTGILLAFEKYPGSLFTFADLVFAICEEFVGPLEELSRDISMGLCHDASKIPSLLLRLYEQAERDCPEIAGKCSDAWDVLFEHRIGLTRDITKAIEQ